MGVAAAGLVVGLEFSAASVRTGGATTARDITPAKGAARVLPARMPAGDVQIGPVAYQARRVPEVHPAQGKTIRALPACVEGWRGLETGPVGRRVLVTCAGPELGATRVASDRGGVNIERRRAPRAVHGSLVWDYTELRDPGQARSTQKP
jgi:hypothetical protein